MKSIQPIVDQVISDAEAALGTKFDEIELDGLDGDRMLDRRIAVLIVSWSNTKSLKLASIIAISAPIECAAFSTDRQCNAQRSSSWHSKLTLMSAPGNSQTTFHSWNEPQAHKEITGYERDMLAKRRAVKQKLDEEEGYKARLETLDTEYRAVLEQVELFMELCQAVSVNTKSYSSSTNNNNNNNGGGGGSGGGGLNAVGTPSAELMVHMQRVHQTVEMAEAALEQVMQQAEQREEQAQRAKVRTTFVRSRSTKK